MSKRHLSPSKAYRNMLGDEVGTSDGSNVGKKLGSLDFVGVLDGAEDGCDEGAEVRAGL